MYNLLEADDCSCHPVCFACRLLVWDPASAGLWQRLHRSREHDEEGSRFPGRPSIKNPFYCPICLETSQLKLRRLLPNSRWNDELFHWFRSLAIKIDSKLLVYILMPATVLSLSICHPSLNSLATLQLYVVSYNLIIITEIYCTFNFTSTALQHFCSE